MEDSILGIYILQLLPYILFILIMILIYLLVYNKIYEWWNKVGVYIYRGLIIWKKENKSGIIKGVLNWYSNRYIVCNICKSDGFVSSCCLCVTKNIRQPNNIYKRTTQCLNCLEVCKPTICICIKKP